MRVSSSMDDKGVAAARTNEGVTVYWRPGCLFCSMLRSGLRRADLPFREINIWDEPDAAAFVRAVARGNETVPTVTVGSTTVVNPSVTLVLELATKAWPDLVQPPGERVRSTGARRYFRRLPVRSDRGEPGRLQEPRRG